MFRTYIGASFTLYRMGILSLDAVVRVVEKTAFAFSSIDFDSTTQKRNLAAEIMDDIALVVDELPSHDAMVLVALLKDDLVGEHDNSSPASEDLALEAQELVADEMV
jgi:hypothetical protein